MVAAAPPYCPGAHRAQFGRPSLNAKRPAAQLAQFLALPEYEPAGQAVQAEEPATLAYWPAAQLVQAGAPPAE